MAKQSTISKTKSQEKPKVKRRFVVEVQGIAPVILHLETWAYDEEEALKQLDNPRLMSFRNTPNINLSKLRRHKVQIKDALSSLIKIVKSF